jgi:hypothetical protein
MQDDYRLSLLKRFWRKVDKHGPTVYPKLGVCWVWKPQPSKGYGHIKVERKMQLAHRVAWYLSTGRWPSPNALHKCDNGRCVRFSHLFEGTQLDNVADRHAKRRDNHPTGETNGRAKLTHKQVQQIKMLASEGKTQRYIGSLFGVTRTNIGYILRGTAWLEKQ